MEELLDKLIASEPFERLLLERSRPLVAHARAGRDFLVAALARALDAPVLLVAPGTHEAAELAQGIAAFLGADRVAEMPAWEALPYDGISPSPEVAARREDAARKIRGASGAFVAVTPVAAALQRFAPTLGTSDPVVVERGANIPLDDISYRLAELGYVRSEIVEHRGEFARRGGIIDVFPGNARRPMRAEFDGDEIASLREFTPATQLSTDRIDRSEVPPVRELLPSAQLQSRAGELASNHQGRIQDGLARIAEGLVFEGMESLAPLLYDDMPVPSDLLPEGSWVVLADARRTLDRARQAMEEANALAEASEWPGPAVLAPIDEVAAQRTRVDLSNLAEGIDLGLEEWGTASGNSPELGTRLAGLSKDGFAIVLAAEGRGSLQRMQEVLRERGLDVDAAMTVEASLTSGFVFAPGRVALVTEEDLFGTRRHTRGVPRAVRRGKTDAVAEELGPSDYAVHTVHGVGRFEGIVHRAVAGSERDYLVLRYAAGDRLYVPTDQVGVVSKYVGGDEPRLHRLGSSDWTRAKNRVRRAVKDMAGELVRLYSVRMAVPGHAFGPDTPWQRELEEAFPHEETRDQLAAIEEVKRDMESDKPMDRLICGDVGYGKTEIAVRAAFKAVMDGKQVAVLVPTTLLAEQHYVTFSERFAPFPVKVSMLSRFLSDREQDEVVADASSGKADVVIGTHRLLSNDVRFKDLGLLIVDEEQRFGVGHKERMKRLRAQVDSLAMTATPIPRTLEMALTGIRDMSVVDTPPEDRQPVLTFVGSYDEQMAVAALRRELLRGGQMFWVHNRIQTLERRAAWIKKAVPEARVVAAHGRMDEDRLEKEMLRFWDGDADVLVCTTIIESGLDVPQANTLVVDAAEKLGLAQMYQLRGRVGRAGERAFAYFFFPPQRSLTEEAHQRLETISRHTALGSGFKIALRDLEIRGAGNLLGAEQHGHIAAVGFETYCRLLQEAVAQMKGEPIPEEKDTKIDLPVRAFIPPEWLGQESLRLELYRRIATASDQAALQGVRAETEDRFGSIPSEVDTLFAVASLRITCERVGVEEISTFKQQVRVRPVALDETAVASLTERVTDASYHSATRTLNLVPKGVPGPELPLWVERALVSALGENEPADILAR
ncbi:MAG: transcription-repair coupling factor [Actinomycetota bacterium]